jgi:hypothetical protein
MDINTQKAFSLAMAAVLKAHFPALGTQNEMPGAATVDALSSLYEKAKLGQPLAGRPDGNPDPTTDRRRTLKAISDAIRDLVSSHHFMKRAKFRDSLLSELVILIEHLRQFRIVAEELSK